MKRNSYLAAVLVVASMVSLGAQQPIVYITPTDDGFETYITAAIHKKKVPVMVSTSEAKADYVLKTSAVEIQKESTGSKVAKCLFASCAGIEDKGTTSVALHRGDIVVWSYSVNKGRGQKNRQSLAEAIAKHLNDDFLKKQK